MSTVNSELERLTPISPCPHDVLVLGSKSKRCARCDLTALYQSQEGEE